MQGGKKVAGETHTPTPPSNANKGRFVRMGRSTIQLKNLSDLPYLQLKKDFKGQELDAGYEAVKKNVYLDNGVIEFEGKKANTKYAFVIKMDGTLNIGDLEMGQHYRLSDGAENVRYAGRIEFAPNGHISEIDNSSGHYTPTLQENTQTVEYFFDNDLIPEEYIIYFNDIDAGHPFDDY